MISIWLLLYRDPEESVLEKVRALSGISIISTLLFGHGDVAHSGLVWFIDSAKLMYLLYIGRATLVEASSANLSL